MFAACRLVLVEGGIDAAGPAIEVWRQAMGGPCLAATHGHIRAVVSDDAADAGVPVWPRSDVPGLARRILDLC